MKDEMDYENTKPMQAGIREPNWAADPDHRTIDLNMTNHAPIHPGVVESFESLRRAAKLFAHMIVDICPRTRERDLALQRAEEALMYAVASVARNQ